MLPSAGRAAGADLGDMDFVDLIELASAMTGEHTTEARHESSAHDNRNAVESGLVIEFEQTSDLRGLIGGRDNGNALMNRPASQTELGPGRRGNDHGGWIVADATATAGHRAVAEIVDKARKSFEVGIADLERVNSPAGPQLPGDPSTGRTGSEEQDPQHQRKSSPRSSRQPPVWGGMPP